MLFYRILSSTILTFSFLDFERSEGASYWFYNGFLFFILYIQNFYQKECFDFNIYIVPYILVNWITWYFER